MPGAVARCYAAPARSARVFVSATIRRFDDVRNSVIRDKIGRNDPCPGGSGKKSFSEVFLHYGAQRDVRFRAGTECPPTVKTAAERLFDAETGWVLPPTRLAALDDFIVAARPRDRS